MSNANDNADYLIHQARAAGITDRRELAIFMGQMQVESGSFRSMHEGLGYRPERLLQVFGPYTDRRGVRHDGRNGLTTLDEARTIVARGQPGIAEAIYGGSWGARELGNTEAGDGWKYHGRGYVQLTGRSNYERVGRELGIDLVTNPDLAADRDIAARIAIHYWQERVRARGHQLDVGAATRDINGGDNHLAERRSAAESWEQRLPAAHPERVATAVASPSATSRDTDQPARTSPVRSRPGAAAIYDEAHRHFLATGNRFEYGRSDQRFDNREGNRRTDPSRTEQDLDRDGLRGVDCSSFVWRGLQNAGYGVPDSPFTTHVLFNERSVTPYAREHFEVVSAADARRDRGPLRSGDILLFNDRDSRGQHVGIFKAYDAKGRIEFIGSQVSTGPAQVRAGQGSYWNGGEFEIVGALRAKPEFQVRAPLHAGARQSVPDVAPAVRTAPDSASPAPRPTRVSRVAEADGILELGEKGPAVATLQRRLADLGYQARNGKPLAIDGDFGADTRDALVKFQRDRGLEGRGFAGPRTGLALDRAERALMTHPSHPHHALYTQVLERVHAEERAKGHQPGHHSQRIAAALAVECLREGITRVDRVELNRDVSIVRGVQVSAVRDEPGLNRTTDGISVAQAAQQTLLESSEQIHQVAVNRQAQVREEQQRHTRPAPALAP